MRKTTSLLIALFFVAVSHAQDAKLLSECTVVYDLTVEDPNVDPVVSNSMAGTTKVVYIKGSKVRSELNSKAFQQVVILDSKTDTSVVLRELGNTKYISYLDSKKRAEQNKRFEGITISNTGETKIILGYECKKAVAKLKDGSVYNVYYAPSIMPSNSQFEYQFKDLPGFPLEYEAQSEDGKTRIKYSAVKITLTPVPVAKFDIPKAGYRVL
jgi:GLPGLI family protein